MGDEHESTGDCHYCCLDVGIGRPIILTPHMMICPKLMNAYPVSLRATPLPVMIAAPFEIAALEIVNPGD